MFSCLGRIQKFFQGRGTQFRLIFKRSFSAELFSSILRIKKAVGRSGDMLPREIFWNFTCCCGHFSTFWTSFKQILIQFFAPNSECCTKYDAFCSYIFHYAYLGRKVYCYRKGSKLWKNCIHQKHVWKRLVGGMHSPHLPLIRLCYRGSFRLRNHNFQTSVTENFQKFSVK